MSDFSQRLFTGIATCLSGENTRAVVVAVSGGSDSMALLILVWRYIKENLPECRLLAATVDHGLRSESAGEAEGVAAFCKKLGIEHQTLCWKGVKPVSGVASAARTARYDLLVQAARASDATIILTGHTADDQVETYLMRRERSLPPGGIVGEGRGLAAMATQTLLQNSIMLCRPLLKIWREELREFLRSEDYCWFDDPSNDNLTYERPRIRKRAATLDKTLLFVAAEQSARERYTDNHRVALLLAHKDCRSGLLVGDALFLSAGWNEHYEDVTPLALAYLLAAIGGQPLLPALSDCAALAGWLQTAPEKTEQRKTLHHCVIGKSSAGILIRRERRNLPVAEIQAGESIDWDGRYRITNESASALVVAPMNEQQLSGYLRRYQAEPGQSAYGKIHRDVLLSAPAIVREDGLTESPALSHLGSKMSSVRVQRIFACFDRVLSGHDFEAAQAVKALLTMPLNHNYR